MKTAAYILEIGAIYKSKWDPRPFRIIGFDDKEVFYDYLLSPPNTWALSRNLKKKVFFCRMSSNMFMKGSEKIDSLPLSEEEYAAFRPDLPLRLGRTIQLSWNNIPVNNYTNFISYSENIFEKDFFNQNLQAPKAMLFPYGNKGGTKKGVTVNADNSQYIAICELIWKAKGIQEMVNNDVSKGIGLYRSGIDKGCPIYYIGEYVDRVGILIPAR
ncbi:hypothetical protein HH214_18810 [Mucilaginibacter robiniae]|uniref:Uncharacterized protein n=1 Tax=Mucilaginibacter robiniae TaxID=2728022 RepID=A0A7L5E580_9SPHI|nr:hypothetical protein [Mucilaginibacter robiniae]QJD97778.1 hypothetical protein HH214_18810 [Mucilaginibacter robiniae]